MGGARTSGRSGDAEAAAADPGANGRGAHARVESIRLQNFRSMRDTEVRLGDITVLIGANGTGKTTVLDALALFASERPVVTGEDYWQGADRIDITLTVDPGGHAVEKRFLRNGVMRLQRSFSRDGEEDKRGIKAETRRNTDFEAARGADGADALKVEAKRLREEYGRLPPYRNRRQFLEDLDRCEEELSGDPRYADRYRDEFAACPGLKELVARMLTVIHVPAMKDIAADGEDGSDSLLSDLMGMAVRDAQGSNRALREISDAMDAEYARYEEAVRGEVDGIRADLAKSSAAYMDGAEFEIDLESPRVSASHPRASVRMGDGGPIVPVGHAGSGFQRVYLLSLLDTIANRRGAARAEDSDGSPPTLRLVAIDEPELYQHPQRQRRILKSFIGVAEGNLPISIVCSTHSPYFVELRRVDKLRLLRKGGRPESITEAELRGLDGRLGEGSTWLDMNATHWITEGFFARRVVVVEGMSDRNALLAAARAMPDVDLDACEISIVPAGGVENVDIIAKLYAWFGVPVYLVWDLDRKNGKCSKGIRDRNERLASIATGGGQGPVPKGIDVGDAYACFGTNLTEVMSGELLDCGGLLDGLPEYKSLKKAAEADRQADLAAKARHCECHECKRLPRPKRAEEPGPATRARKRVLKSRMSVSRMLEGVRGGDGGKFEELMVVRIVRMIWEIEGCEERARRAGRGAAAGGLPDGQ